MVRNSGKHGDEDGGEGSAYKVDLYFNGEFQLAKEQYHVEYTKTDTQPGIGPINGKWVGFKAIIYNTQAGGGTAVKTELWLDENNNNQWTKNNEYVDGGQFGKAGTTCKGRPTRS